MAGDFCWSITVSDVHTQWTETRAVFNRGALAVKARIAEIEAALPFAILGALKRNCEFSCGQPKAIPWLWRLDTAKRTACSQTGCSGLAPAPELCPCGAPAAATSPL
jgi:hypothetical protein